MPRETPIEIEMWSDIVCPFCWIGKRHLEAAIRRLGMQDDVRLVHRAYQLDPHLAHAEPLRAHLARKFGGDQRARAMQAHVSTMGAPAGLAFDWDRAIVGPTRDAHRLVKHANARGGLGDRLVERLMRAHFAEGRDVSDPQTLVALAAEAGLDADDAARALATRAHADDVERDATEAQALGARGVPFFVIDRRIGVSGAQPIETFEHALRKAAERADAAT